VHIKLSEISNLIKVVALIFLIECKEDVFPKLIRYRFQLNVPIKTIKRNDAKVLYISHIKKTKKASIFRLALCYFIDMTPVI